MKTPDDAISLLQADLPELGPPLEFLRMLWALDSALQRRSKHMLKVLGVTGPQRLALRLVGRFPGIPAGDLARILRLHPSTLTGVLSRLRRRSLVHLRSDPRDRRRVLVSLTAAGRRVNLSHDSTVETAVRDALARIPHSQVEAAERVLAALTRALEPPVDPGS